MVIDQQYHIILANKNRIKAGNTKYDRADQVIRKKCYEAFMIRDTPCPWCHLQIYTMLGYEPKEARIKFETWMDLMHPEDKSRVMPVVKEAVWKKERYSVEFRLKTKDGHYKWISGRAKTFQMDDNDEIYHVMGVHVDIDVLKYRYKEL